VPVDVIVPVFRDNVALERLLIGLGDGPLLQRMRVVFGEADAIGEALAERYGVAWSRANRAGRAMQMNHGSVSAAGEVLLFLHADLRPPRDALEAIEKAVREGAVGGAFTRRLESPSHFLRLTCWLADWRGRAFGVFLGDQGLLCGATPSRHSVGLMGKHFTRIWIFHCVCVRLGERSCSSLRFCLQLGALLQKVWFVRRWEISLRLLASCWDTGNLSGFRQTD
jgi:glycosyltransferase involved in cell wall biosynthesis